MKIALRQLHQREGLRIYRGCSSELNKDKIPKINGMDTGVGNTFWWHRMLENDFEIIFIKFVIDKLKGFAVHIPYPLNSTIKELFGHRPSKLFNLDKYYVLHGIPKKDDSLSVMSMLRSHLPAPTNTVKNSWNYYIWWWDMVIIVFDI